MNYLTAKPSPLLAPFIKQYWALANCFSASEEYLYRIIPSGLMELIFYLEDKPGTVQANKEISEHTCISGQQNDFYDLKIKGKLSIFSVLLKPQGAMMFFNIPAKEIFNQNIPLKHIIKNEVSALENSLYEAPTFNKKIKIIEKFLLTQLIRNHKHYEFKRLSAGLNLINQSRGLVDIQMLAYETCFSRKQFERYFKEYIGTSPKQFLKIIRFQNAIDQKYNDQSRSLTDLTFDCGYYDQAHMINEFKIFSGKTPKQFFAECNSCSDYFLD